MKRIIAIVVSMALVLGTFGSTNVFAANIPTMTVESVSGEVGQTVSVNVVLENNPGFSSSAVKISYDEIRLTLVSATLGSQYSTGAFVNYNLPYITFVRSNNVEEDGIFLTLSFTIKSADGDGNVTIEYADGDITDIDENNVTFHVVDGTISVECSHDAKTEVPSKSADCVNSGNNLYYTCDSCGVVLKADGITETTVEAEMIPALGHDLSAATCTEAAKCQHEGCSHVEGNALGHSFTNYMPNGDATCTENGTKTAKCDRCDATDTITDVGSTKGHDYADATCTAPKTCKTCGTTEGNALGHSFTNYVSNGNATCTEDGTKTAKCDRCDATDTITDIGSAKGHDYADATCTAPKTCKTCGTTEGNALGHSFTNYVSNGDATCTEDGTKTAKCDRCDATDTITDVGSTKGHDYADATCTTPKTCRVCGTTEGDPLGHTYASTWRKGEDGHWHECSACGDKTDFAAHDYGTEGDNCIVCEYERTHVHRLTLVPAVDATCTTDGNVAYYTCSGCENWFEDASGAVVISDKSSVMIVALGHDLSAATCTEAAKCQRAECDYVEGNALGHSFTNYVSNGDATCTEDGTKTAKCDRCDATDTITDVGSTKGHDYADTTCTTPKTCKTCGNTEGNALGHSFTNYMSNGDATCTEDGTKTAKCDRCDATDTITDVGSAKGHDYADATCTTPKTCRACGTTEGDSLGHSYASTWSKGENGHWHECSACGDKTDFAAHDYGTEGDNCVACEYERAHVHRLTLVPAVDAICTTDGNVAYYTCSGCENWFEDASGSIVISDKTSVVVAALGHDMTEATCTEPSYCKREGCEHTEGTALGHSFTNHVSNDDVTCTEDGTKTAKCDRCDATDTITEVGSAKGHDYADATCTAPKTCKTCGATEGEPLGHSYASTWSKGEDGHWHECPACGDKTDLAAHDYSIAGNQCIICEYERAHVHRLTLVPSVDATCTEDGNKAYYICSGCEDWFEDALGTVVIPDKTSVVIAAMGHDMSEATCTEVTHCQREGCDYTEGAALGHTDANADNKCDRCGITLDSNHPTTPDKPADDIPQTGDNSNTMLWATLLILSFAGIVVCVEYNKKRNVA